MANLFKQLQALKTNIFGGKGNTGFQKPPATRVQDIDLQASPTGLLTTDPLSSSILKYPLDVSQNFQNGHYMIFYVNVQDKTKYEYSLAKAFDLREIHNKSLKGLSDKEKRYSELQTIKSGRDLRSDGGEEKGDSKTYKTIQAGPPGQPEEVIETDHSTKKGVSSAFNNTRRISDAVSIYLPPNVEETTSATYNDSKTGVAGFLIASGAAALKEGGDAAAITKSIVAGTKGLLGDSAARAIGGVAEIAGAEGVEALTKKAFGEADNPYMEVLFDSMSLRTFTYNFNMAPRSQAEAFEIQRIIQLFRFHMAPDLQEVNARYLTLPSEFDIHYMYKAENGVGYENDYYGRIGTCVLENVSTNYAPNGVKSFADGAPTQITMSLTFRETETLTKEKINQGF